MNLAINAACRIALLCAFVASFACFTPAALHAQPPAGDANEQAWARVEDFLSGKLSWEEHVAQSVKAAAEAPPLALEVEVEPTSEVAASDPTPPPDQAPLPPDAPEHGHFSVIAYSPSTGDVGWTTNYPTAREAKLAAVAQCGNYDARPVGCCWNGHYTALVVGENGAWLTASGKTPSEAKRLAFEYCRKHPGSGHCRVRICIESTPPIVLFGSSSSGNRCSRCGQPCSDPFGSYCGSCQEDFSRRN